MLLTTRFFKSVLSMTLYLSSSFSNANSDSYVKAEKSLVWDSENKSYTANGNVEFKNDKFTQRV